MGVNLSENALKIFETLYSKEGESVEDTFRRVSKEYGKEDGLDEVAYNFLVDNVWRPNTPTFFNAGISKKIYSACFVGDIDDSMDSIYELANVARRVFQAGSGIGIPIGKLREKDAPIFETDFGLDPDIPKGFASGPVEFLDLYDAVGHTTKSGGRSRRAAILSAMSVDHPDIIGFIRSKEKKHKLSNMNISVSVTDKFMEHLNLAIPFDLVSPTGVKKDSVLPEVVWAEITKMAWKTADPGIIFIDNVNKLNPLKSIVKISVSNPCGEQFLPPWGACNLSHINVTKFITADGYDFDALFETAATVTRMMDNLLDIMEFPDVRFKDTALKYRFIGLGMMGLADTLFMMGLKYNSKEGRDLAGEIMRTITHGSIRASAELAEERGAFPEYKKVEEDLVSIVRGLITPANHDDPEVDITMRMIGRNGLRHASHTTIAPTGTCAISCDASYGMEPSFGLAFTKNVMDGSTMIFTNSIFESQYKEESWYNQELLDKIVANNGSLKNLRGIPKEIRDVFVVAHDIKPRERIDMQAALQKHCSNAISSTCNLPNDVTVEEISDLFKYAYEKNLKGITVYRDGCKEQQPVTFGEKRDDAPPEKMQRPKKLKADSYCIELSDGTLYPIVSTYNKKPFDIFLQIGKSGQEKTGLVEWCGRLLSLALRHCVPVKDIVKQSVGIHAGDPNWYKFEDDDKKPEQLLGIPDAVGKLLKRYYSGEDTNGANGLICVKCGQATVDMAEGCPVCYGCGWSKCS